jgi:hypothetical protein
MFIQKSRLSLASAAVLFAFANGATMASAYAADQGTQEVAPCYGSTPAKDTRIASRAAMHARAKIPAKAKDLRILPRHSAANSTA